MIEDLREGWAGVRAHRVRSFLSALGILFGVAALLAIQAIGEGARQEQERLIGQLGILNFLIENRDFGDRPDLESEAREKSVGLTERDVLALRGALPGARRVGAMRELGTAVSLPQTTDDTRPTVVAADPEYLRAWHLVTVEGRPLAPLDERDATPVAWLGVGARNALFGGREAVGAAMWIHDVPFRVVGVYRDPASGSAEIEGFDLDDRNRQVLIPLSAARLRLPTPSFLPPLSGILVALGDARDVPGHVDVARRALDRLHAGAEDVEIVVPLKLLEQSRAQQRVFNLVMGLIAGISLLVGGIGIMNILFASVLERTREIGIRLAVGASPADVQRLFLVESALISGIGGVAGIGAGLALAWAVGAATGWATALSVEAVVGVTLVAMVEGVVFGWIPARQAARLSPAIAMRQAG